MERSKIITTLPSFCSVCRNLDYHLFESDAKYGGKEDGVDRTRYLILDFQCLKVSAEGGCWTCDIINRGTRLFWGEYPEILDENSDDFGVDENLAASIDDDNKIYRLCLETRPSKSLTALRFVGQFWVFGGQTRMEFFTKDDIPPLHPAFGHAKAVVQRLTIESATETINSWLTTCEQTHLPCQTPLAQLPRRVLNVAGELPKLIENSGSIEGRYITLSHCWGQNPHVRPSITTLSNVKNRKEGIPLDQLCPLFRDFVELARHLGCEFVWIDSLCIIQDDLEDWIKESVKMADVYSHAVFNVAATSLPNSSCRLFVDRASPDSWDPLNLPALVFAAETTVSIRASHRSDHGYLFDRVFHERWRQVPLLTRAWVLQERLLARRSINFCGSELIWECRCTCNCECKGMDPPADSQSHNQAMSLGDIGAASASNEQFATIKQLFSQVHQGTLSPQRTYIFWLDLVREYSNLELSKPLDRHYAFAGITGTFSRVVKDKCLAGIWENDMASGLNWVALPSSSYSNSRSHIAPTWSWMSPIMESEGQFYSYISYGKFTNTFIRDKRLSISHRAPGVNLNLESSKNTILDITAAIIPARISIASLNWEAYEYCINLQHSNLTWANESFKMWADCPGPSGDNIEDGEECLCLLLGRNEHLSRDCFIVLRKCLVYEDGLFNRIGRSIFDGFGFSLFDNAEVRTLSII